MILFSKQNSKISKVLCVLKLSYIILANEDFDRVKLEKHDASLIHVIYILLKNGRILQYLSDHLKPAYDFIIYIIMVLVQRLIFTCSKFWMAFIKKLRPILI